MHNTSFKELLVKRMSILDFFKTFFKGSPILNYFIVFTWSKMVKEKLSYEWVMIFVMSIGCLYFVLITFLNNRYENLLHLKKKIVIF